MRIGVVFAGVVVPIRGSGLVWGELLEPNFIVAEQTVFVIVDEYRRRDVHGVDKAESLTDTAFAHQLFNGAGNIHKPAPALHFEPEMFRERLHSEIVLPSAIQSS